MFGRLEKFDFLKVENAFAGFYFTVELLLGAALARSWVFRVENAVLTHMADGQHLQNQKLVLVKRHKPRKKKLLRLSRFFGP